MKAGRNEPCPCGSGKKYKKCCLAKDEQIVLDEVVNNRYYEPEIDEWEPEDDFEGEELEVDEDEEVSEEEKEVQKAVDMFFGDFSGSETGDETKTSELPEISDEERKLVDGWWEKYKQMTDSVEEQEHLQSFINLYPHLVDHLELYHEVLFEIGSEHFRKGIYDEFVKLLLKIRDEYPATYQKSFEYYDSDLIYWYAAQERLDEIDKFFDYFLESKEHSDELDDLIDFFLAINRQDIILTSFAGTKHKEYISWIIYNNIIQKYIDYPATDELIQQMMSELEKEGVVEKTDTIENLKELFSDSTRSFTSWGELPMKRSEACAFYYKIFLNFKYFLHKKAGLSFSSANVFAITVYDYYCKVIGQLKRPADMFYLDEKNIMEYSVKRYNTLFWGYKMKSLIALNAFYWFADYLKICGNISEEQKNSVLEMLANMYQKVYEISKDQGAEMLSFVQFPLWTIKK